MDGLIDYEGRKLWTALEKLGDLFGKFAFWGGGNLGLCSGVMVL